MCPNFVQLFGTTLVMCIKSFVEVVVEPLWVFGFNPVIDSHCRIFLGEKNIFLKDILRGKT